MNPSIRRRAGVTLAWTALGLMAYGPACMAQSTSDEDDDSAWDVGIGAGAVYHPDYEGSDDYEIDPVPVLLLNYRDIIMLRGPGLMLDVFQLTGSELADDLSFGAIVKYDDGRERDDNTVLWNLTEIDSGMEAGVFAEYELGPVSFGLTAVTDTGTRHEGTLAELKIGYERALGMRLLGEVGISASWADDDYTQSYFGISARDAQASGLRQYTAEGGLKDAGVAASLHYLVSEHWRVTGRLAYRRLLGDAADSPLVEDEGAQNQAMGAVIVSYSF